MPLEFHPLSDPAQAVGLALRVGANDRFLRITHLFRTSAYVMWVRDSEDARYACRPARIPLMHLEEIAASPGSCWGTLSLPETHLNKPLPRSELEQLLDAAWRLIEPLVRMFDQERNLDRAKFSKAIRYRAERTGTNFITLRRLLLRYYYFGRSKLALLPLPPGPTSTNRAPSDSGSLDMPISHSARRRGRQPVLAKPLGRNEFIVSEEDIWDMLSCLKRQLRKGVTYITAAHEEYLKEEFRSRHGKEYKRYAAGQSVEPVTSRQFRYYVNRFLRLNDDLAKNLRLNPREKGYRNALRSNGPGEIYEIDATGGRIVLVSSDDPPKLLGTPTIYIIIDRWSRYIPSVYVSLQKPSYEEVCVALLISFTSRERFRFICLDIDEQKWPVGVPPACVCADRGSELTCESIQQALSDDLRIDLINLPPYTPDAKAIVERLIRELKRRITISRVRGVFADRPMDPNTKRAKRQAVRAAVRTIVEIYRVIWEVVDDHNNRPHAALRRRPLLAQAGVRPTPREAYLWGLKNLTGLKRPPLTDKDIYRLLLSADSATISNGVLRYRNRAYNPANDPATEICEHSPRRATKIKIKVERSTPFELFIPCKHGDWAQFRITEGGAAELLGVTLDEEEALAPVSRLLAATADHEAKVARVTRKSTHPKAEGRRRGRPVAVDREEQYAAAVQETADVKAHLKGQRSPTRLAAKRPSAIERWKELAEAERLQAVETSRKRLGLP